MNELIAWWHRAVLRHDQLRHRVTVPMVDLSARGIYVKCSCRKTWSL